MNVQNLTLNSSWLHGQYTCGEINTKLSYVSVNGTQSREEYYAQGDDADNIIDEIHSIWINSDLTEEQAFRQWINSYL